MFIRHGSCYLAVSAIYRATWLEDEGALAIRVAPADELVRLDGDEAIEAREKLDALCIRLAPEGETG